MKSLLQTTPSTERSNTIAIPLDPPARRVIGAEFPRGMNALRGGLLIVPIGLAMWAGILWLVIG
jgi:hypothetical protein